MVEGQGRELEGRVRGDPPASMQVRYYGRFITVSAPPLASACLSVFILTMEPNQLRYTPGGREQYVPGRTFSERVDDEWFRLVMCPSITSAPRGLDGRRFTPSTLVGSWRGTVLVRVSTLRFKFDPNSTDFGPTEPNHPQVPQLVEFEELVLQRRDPVDVPFKYFESRMELHEHHCLGEEMYIMPGLGPDRISDNPLNAWFPHNATFEENEVSVVSICELLHLFFSRVEQ